VSFVETVIAAGTPTLTLPRKRERERTAIGVRTAPETSDESNKP
jgi:hypothetical protein